MRLLPLDFHCHIDESIPPGDLRELQAVTFAATKSLDQARRAVSRADKFTVWGVGCHPALVGAQKAFDPDLFASLLSLTPFVSEVGLDGDSRVPAPTQRRVLGDMLEVLEFIPRIISIHSYRACPDVLNILKLRDVPGVILHWWLGTEEETTVAVKLGCYFSINASSVRRTDLMRRIPITQILTETDHPAGDRFGSSPHQPGNVSSVERDLARFHKMTPQQIREQIWQNFDRLVLETGTLSLLPRAIRAYLHAL